MNVDPATIVKLQNLWDYLYCLESPPDMNDPRGQILLELIDILIWQFDELEAKVARLEARGITGMQHRIAELEAELARFRPQPGSFTADEARALKSGELTIWLRDGQPSKESS